MATYYVAEGGTAANKAAATSGTYPTGCLSPAGHNAETFAAGDEILFSDEGGDIRAQITPPSSGSSGSPIVYGKKTGDSPHIKGSNLIATWTAAGATGNLINLDFEEGDLTDWASTTANGTTAVAASTTQANGGTYSFRFTGDGASAVYGINNTFTEQGVGDTYYCRFYAYFASGSLGTSQDEYLFAFADGSTMDCFLQIRTDGSGNVNDAGLWGGSGWKPYSFNPGIAMDQWVMIEVAFTLHATTGGVQVWVDGVSKTSTLDYDTSSYIGIDRIRLGQISSGGLFADGQHIYFDDVAVSNSGPIGSASAGVWQAACTTDPADQVWMDGTWGDEKASIETLVNEYDWFWNSNVLYIFAATDPDARYTTPGVEAAARSYCVDLTDLSYVTLQDVELSQTLDDCVRVHSGSAQHTDVSLIRVVAHDSSKENNGQTIYFDSVNDGLISECEAYNSGWNGIAVTCNWGGYDQDGTVIEKCYSHDNDDHNGFDIHIRGDSGSLSNITIKHCRAEDNSSDDGIFIYQENCSTETLTNINVLNNVCVGNAGSGIAAYTGSGTDITGLKIYGNTLSGNGVYGLWAVVQNSDFKNNLIAENTFSVQMGIRDSGGTANTADYNLVWATAGGDVCDWNNNFCTHEELFSVYAQDEHGVSSDPSFTNAVADDFTLASDSPCIDEGVGLGASYDDALLPASTWPSSVTTGDQDDYGVGWNIGAYLYGTATPPTPSTGHGGRSIGAHGIKGLVSKKTVRILDEE